MNKELRVMGNEGTPNSKFQAPNSTARADLGRPWVIILITLAIFFASQFLALMLVSVGLAVIQPTVSIAKLLDESAATQFFYVATAEALVLTMIFLAVKKWRKLSLGSIGFGRWPQWRDLKGALGGAMAFYALLIATSILITYLVPDLDVDAEQDVGFNVLNTAMDQALAFIALVILPPIGEETLMRGYLYSGLRAYWRFVPAALVTSVLFGVAHLGTGAAGVTLWIAGINTFLLSLVLVYLRERTGALYAPMMVHAANNLIAFGVHFR